MRPKDTRTDPMSASNRPAALDHAAFDRVAFDHAAIAVRDRMDAALGAFSRMGFVLTPRGHHTLGSINHLIVLGTTYVELIGFPSGQADVRPELRDAPIGLNGLVLRSVDADATHAAAQARGAPVTAVQSFSRPVDAGGVSRDARFRTVRTAPGASPSGRLYFCEHLTPELVWRPEWQDHPNGALELVGAQVRVTDVAAEAALYRALLGAGAVADVPGGFDVTVPPVTIAVRAGAQPAMTGLTLQVSAPDRVREWLVRNGVGCTRDGDAVVVPPHEAFGVSFRFGPASAAPAGSATP
jgi:hypothetical protein